MKRLQKLYPTYFAALFKYFNYKEKRGTIILFFLLPIFKDRYTDAYKRIKLPLLFLKKQKPLISSLGHYKETAKQFA